MFFFITLPHLKRAIAVVVMMETIFLLSIFAEIYTTTGGGPGTATTNLSYLIYALGLQQFDVGLASAGGILAVVLANIVVVLPRADAREEPERGVRNMSHRRSPPTTSSVPATRR